MWSSSLILKLYFKGNEWMNSWLLLSEIFLFLNSKKKLTIVFIDSWYSILVGIRHYFLKVRFLLAFFSVWCHSESRKSCTRCRQTTGIVTVMSHYLEHFKSKLRVLLLASIVVILKAIHEKEKHEFYIYR